MTQQFKWSAAILGNLLLLSACSSQPEHYLKANVEPHQPVGTEIQKRREASAAATPALPTPSASTTAARSADRRFELISAGDGMIDRNKANSARAVDRNGEITLNFNEADINEIGRTILGDILQRNYTIDERVSGAFSLHTSRPVSSEALIPILESMLQANGALLHDNGSLIEIVPQSQVLLSRNAPRLKLDASRGYQTLVVPLRFIAVTEMAKILGATADNNQGVEVDKKRNILLLTGTHNQLAGMLDTIDIFDVNQLKGMAMAMMELETVSTRTMLEELASIFSEKAEGPLAGMVQFIPIERLNSLLIITPQQQYLEAARGWVERLDRNNSNQHTALHVYKVRHSTAEHLAELLGQLFNPGNSEIGTDEPGLLSADTEENTTQRITLDNPANSLPAGSAVNIIADKQNNALLIMASDTDYQRIKVALNKLDVLPMQVLVEASIVEVTLSDDLFYGLEWFFKNGLDSGLSGQGQLDLGSAGLAPASPGFSYSVVDSAGAVRAVFNTLASDNKVNVVSSPSLMVLDNQAASIRVGDQVPIRTSETTNTGSSGADPLVTSTIQFRDTGVLLEVTPQIKEGGMVVLEINQDVSDVAQTTSSGIDSPTINQRQINTTVAVHSGDTIVLGGLIRDNQDNGNSGVPGLRNVPVLGWAFGETRKKRRRTELVVLITPTAITSRDEAREVTREFRNHLKGLKLPAAFSQPGS